jgi:hypothetical protein
LKSVNIVHTLLGEVEKVPKRKTPEIVPVERKDFQANMSALLYLLTEQQALLGRLLQELIRVGALNNEGLSRITELETDPEGKKTLYAELYTRYAGHVTVYRRIIEELEDDKTK